MYWGNPQISVGTATFEYICPARCSQTLRQHPGSRLTCGSYSIDPWTFVVFRSSKQPLSFLRFCLFLLGSSKMIQYSEVFAQIYWPISLLQVKQSHTNLVILYPYEPDAGSMNDVMASSCCCWLKTLSRMSHTGVFWMGNMGRWTS